MAPTPSAICRTFYFLYNIVIGLPVLKHYLELNWLDINPSFPFHIPNKIKDLKSSFINSKENFLWVRHTIWKASENGILILNMSFQTLFLNSGTEQYNNNIFFWPMLIYSVEQALMFFKNLRAEKLYCIVLTNSV